jgi:hypothetical protein
MAQFVAALALAFAWPLAPPLPAAEPTKVPTVSVPEGKWGGIGLLVEVGPSGAKVELDAAHGKTAGPLALDAAGRFDVEGTLARERPGPIRPGDVDAPGAPVRYRGKVEADTLTLEIVPAGKGETIGPLTAVRGAPARLRKMY